MEENQPVTGPSETEETPANYTDVYEAPSHLRILRGARLSLAQINELVADAYNNRITSGDSTIPDFGGAKRRFEQKYEIEKRFWVAKENTDVHTS
jgi:hypothetical protein